MLYREAGQFKTTYAADQQLFPIRQDRIGVITLLLVAFLGVPLFASEYWFSAILIPFLIFALAALEKSLGADMIRIRMRMKFGRMIVSTTMIAKPTIHNQGESAVTMRPPSRKPTGARLNRLRKKPVYASARNIGLPVAR